MSLHELAHVQPDHGLLAAKVVGGQCLGQLRLAHTSRATEDEGCNGPVGVLQTYKTQSMLLYSASRQQTATKAVTRCTQPTRRTSHVCNAGSLI